MSVVVNQEQSIYKIIVVGDVNVGKTSIIQRYCDNNFVEYYRDTKGIDLKKKKIYFKNKTIVLHIWDTAGSEKYQSLVQLYYRGAMGLCLVYDVTNQNSFHNLDTWMKNIEFFAPSNVVKILVANKCDMESERQVLNEDGQTIAEHFGMPFFDVSSKTNENIDDLFLKMVSLINEREIENTIKKDFVVLSTEETPSDISSSRCTC